MEWKRFTKWQRKKSDVFEWKDWFESKGKECEIKRVDSLFALYIYQEWVSWN